MPATGGMADAERAAVFLARDDAQPAQEACMRLLTAATLCGVLIGSGPGCGDEGPAGDPGDPGTSCTVTDNGDGTKTVTCGDATVIVSDGTPGASGDDCSVVDNGDGTATITCGTGTPVVVRLPEGPGGTASPFTPDPTVNYWSVHDPACPGYDGDCMACHAEQLDQGTLDDMVPGFHQVKLEGTSIPGATDNERCVYCHIEVDLSNNRSAANLRRNVSADLCADCHSAGMYVFYRTP
jgi:hypothetical protein